MCKCNIQITEAAVFWLKLKCVLHKCQIIKTLNTFFSVNENCDAKIIIHSNCASYRKCNICRNNYNTIFFYHNLSPTLIVRFKCVNLAGQELTAEESFGLFWKALTDNILALNIMSGLVWWRPADRGTISENVDDCWIVLEGNDKHVVISRC